MFREHQQRFWLHEIQALLAKARTKSTDRIRSRSVVTTAATGMLVFVCWTLITTPIQAQVPDFMGLDRGTMSPTTSSPFENPVGGGIEYTSATGPNTEVQSYKIPLIVPLEATLGDFYLGGAVNYNMNRYSSTTGQKRIHESSHFQLSGKYQALEGRKIRLEIHESVNLPLGRSSKLAYGVPPEAMINTSGLQLNTGLTMSYFMKESWLQLGVGHQLDLEQKDKYQRGDRVSARVTMGYGIAQPLPQTGPLDLLMGFSSRYDMADRFRGNQLRGTEYGTVFFTPGLQLSGRSMSIQAMVEYPVHHIRPGNGKVIEEDIRANFGMKYYIR